MAAVHTHASRAVEAADVLVASLEMPVGGKPKNAVRGQRDDIDDRNA